MRRITTSALLLATLALAGCGGPVNRGLESVNQPVVSRTDYVFDVAADRLGPTSPEAERLAAWFDALALGYGDKVSIDDPSHFDQTTRDIVAAILARRGLLLSDAAPVTAGAIAPGSARIVVSRSNAAVPDCPNWDRPSQPEFASSGMSNYGCATNSNLAAMVANPEDLVRGQAANGSDARTVAKAIKQYRDTAPTGSQGLKAESAKGQ